MSCKSARVNLSVPIDVAIEIERFCAQAGIKRTSFMLSAIEEKLYNKSGRTTDERIELLFKELHAIRKDLMLIKESI